jgi:catechol 2,3-dioxygenase-like lactoylglutathione lyase family enzyme
MTISALDHYTIKPADLDASVAFYTEVLGLSDGPRPAFDSPGAWLYCGDRPVVHLVTGGTTGKDTGTGAIDHVAFRASGLDDYRARLNERAIAFRERDVPGQPLHQIFLTDPDGITIEINFRGEA